MKANKTIFILACILNVIIGKAEIFPTLSIVELSFYADTVIEARFLKKENEDFIFLIEKSNQKDNYDTLIVNNINSLFNKLGGNQSYYSSRQKIGFENCDKLLIYLAQDAENKMVPVWSGYRLLKDDFIYLPAQPENPGKFSFARSSDSITWNELLTRVELVHTRVQNLKRIKNIKDPYLRNIELFNWIDHNKIDFGQDCGWNDDCGWGTMEWDVFKWITEGNISKDTWKASQLYREVNAQSEAEWKRSLRILRDANGNSFNTYDDIDFLINITLDSSKTGPERNQALIYLKLASKKVYENNYPLPDSTTLAFQFRKQKSIRDHLLPLLHDDNLKHSAFRIISAMSNPRDGSLKHRIEYEALPTIIKHYQEEKPSEYRSDLAEFIVYNVSKEEWQMLTNCDENIFVDLYQIRVNSTTSTLRFGINYKNGKETINEIPIVEIRNLASDKLAIQMNDEEFELPFSRWNGVRYLKVDLNGLDRGKYKVYVKGKAGENSQYNWVSEYGEFEIQ